MLKVQTALPDERLRNFVRTYVQRESGTRDDEIVEPVVARLGVMLEFQFGRPLEVPIYGTADIQYSPQICVIGPMSQRTYRLLIRDHVEALTVLFRPQAFHALFRIPTSTFSDVGVEGHSVLGCRVSDLFEQLGNARTFGQRVQLLDSYLIEALANTQPIEPIHRAINSLFASAAQIEICQLAQQSGFSIRHLERKSLQFTGLSPKVTSRVARFQRALRLKSSGTHSWAQVAYSVGYFDQMHMIHDFKSFTGEVPSRALEQIGPDHLISF